MRSNRFEFWQTTPWLLGALLLGLAHWFSSMHRLALRNDALWERFAPSQLLLGAR
jgi:hypothetical protein